jgi:predicted neuraminidase
MLYNIPMPRTVLIIVTIALYLVPLAREMSERKMPAWEDAGVTRPLYPSASAQEALFTEGFVNNAEKSVMSHVSTIAPLPEGRMAAAWYSGSREGAKDVSVYLSFFAPETGSWSRPEVLVDRRSARCELGTYVKKVGNPVLHSQGDTLWLFYSTVAVGGWSGSSLNYKISHDRGVTWNKSRKMYLNPFFNLTNNVKNRPLPLDDGSFVLPVYHEFISKFSQAVRITPVTGDAVSIKAVRMTSRGSASQPSLVPAVDDDSVIAYYRSMGSEKQKHILTNRGEAAGRAWSALKDTPLPNPNSGFDTILMPDGTILAVINDSYKNRENLTLYALAPKAKRWEKLYVFENEKDEEFSYPSLARATDGTYHLTYTYKRKRIKHVMFNDQWIKEQAENADGS